MIHHPYFGDIKENYDEFGGQTTTIENTTINGKQVNCDLYTTEESLQVSTLDALADQHKHLDMLDAKAREFIIRMLQANQVFIYDYLSSIEEYDSDIMAELEEQASNGDTITSEQFVSALKANMVWLSSAADEEIYKYEPGLLESNIEDKGIHTHLSYYIEGVVIECLLFVHFNLQGEFVKVTFGPEY